MLFIQSGTSVNAALPYMVIIVASLSSIMLYLGEVGLTERMYYRYLKHLHDKKLSWSSAFHHKQSQ